MQLDLFAFSGIADAFDGVAIFAGKLYVVVAFGLIVWLLATAGSRNQTFVIILQLVTAALILLTCGLATVPFAKPLEASDELLWTEREFREQAVFLGYFWYLFLLTFAAALFLNWRKFAAQQCDYSVDRPNDHAG